MLTTSPAARPTTSPPADDRTTNTVAPDTSSTSPTAPKDAAAPPAKSSVIAAQEQQLRAKYGNAIPSRGSAAARLRSARDRRKYFDSGDYALAKAAGRPADAAAGIPLVGPRNGAPQKTAVAGAAPPRATAPPVAPPAGNAAAKAQVQAAP
ncbi:hypothetical protein GGF32_007508 [Allomyces javanicus]|nr:hypothetical protein GGF32_007508 [Allomyces javanicus]